MMRFNQNNTEGFTTEQLTFLNEAFYNKLERAISNLNEDDQVNDDLIDQIKKKISDDILNMWGGNEEDSD